MKPLAVFTADLHLEDGAWTSRPTIYGDAYFSFDQIINYCINHELPLILGGDVLERKSNSARPIVRLCQGMNRMQAADLRVLYIQGNHEYDRNAPWLSVHRWPAHVHERMFKLGDVWFYGLDWLPKGDIQKALQNVPKEVGGLVTHQVWDDFMCGLGRVECTLTDVHHAHTVLAGDFHVTKIVQSVNAQGQPIQMLSPGSICMQDLGEAPDKFFFVVGQNETTGAIEFERVPLSTRRFAKYVVADQAELDELCAGRLAADVRALTAAATPEMQAALIDKPLVRIKFDKRLPDAHLRLSTAVGDTCHLFCEALPNKEDEARATAARSSAKNDLLATLGELLGDNTPPYRLAAALVAADDPAREVEVLHKNYEMEIESDAATATGSAELGAPSAAGV